VSHQSSFLKFTGAVWVNVSVLHNVTSRQLCTFVYFKCLRFEFFVPRLVRHIRWCSFKDRLHQWQISRHWRQNFHFYLVMSVTRNALTVIVCRLTLRGWRPVRFKEQYSMTFVGWNFYSTKRLFGLDIIQGVSQCSPGLQTFITRTLKDLP
jgi:hypothetical protein